MAEDLISSTGKGLVYEDHIPLRWNRLTSPLPPARRSRLDQQNEEMLAFISILEEHKGEAGEDEHDPHRVDLLRVEHKVNLLLDMVGQLLARQTDMPAPVPVRLTPEAIEWRAGDAPLADDRLLLEIFISNKYPTPLVFSGQVRAVEPGEGGARVVVAFEGSSESVTHALEKLIFRHHRRLVALARRRQEDAAT